MPRTTDRGANVASIELEQGNIIKNQRQFDWQGSFNLQSLYNKNKYLKKINQKFMASSRVSARQPEKKKKEVKLEKEIQLSPDSERSCSMECLRRRFVSRHVERMGRSIQLNISRSIMPKS